MAGAACSILIIKTSVTCGRSAAARSGSVARDRHCVEGEGGRTRAMQGMQKLGLLPGRGSRKGHPVPFPQESSWEIVSISPSFFLCSLFFH